MRVLVKEVDFLSEVKGDVTQLSLETDLFHIIGKCRVKDIVISVKFRYKFIQFLFLHSID